MLHYEIGEAVFPVRPLNSYLTNTFVQSVQSDLKLLMHL